MSSSRTVSSQEDECKQCIKDCEDGDPCHGISDGECPDCEEICCVECDTCSSSRRNSSSPQQSSSGAKSSSAKVSSSISGTFTCDATQYKGCYNAYKTPNNFCPSGAGDPRYDSCYAYCFAAGGAGAELYRKCERDNRCGLWPTFPENMSCQACCNDIAGACATACCSMLTNEFKSCTEDWWF